MSAAALAAVERALGGDEPDDVLRDAIAALVEHGGCAWAGILFVEDGTLVLGPSAGEPQPESRSQLPVVFQRDRVAELVADGCGDGDFLERVAALLAPYCLVGWDTGGVPWESVS
ncbi:MAG TPA: hypothetical protein VG652_04415 [Gaiellaceae bacterium]|nr:hypothetical protein [Gaiellaceae bacterium]